MIDAVRVVAYNLTSIFPIFKADSPRDDVTRFARVVTASVDPATWEGMGADAAVRVVNSEGSVPSWWLLIAQSGDAHGVIQRLLETVASVSVQPPMAVDLVEPDPNQALEVKTYDVSKILPASADQAKALQLARAVTGTVLARSWGSWGGPGSLRLVYRESVVPGWKFVVRQPGTTQAAVERVLGLFR